jgi:NADH dehydrogenase
VTNEYLELHEWPGVWALGDRASVTDHKTGRPYPPTAQHALRQGKTVAKNVTAAIRGGTKTRLSFPTLGLLESIGRRSGVANILGINFSGFVAWFLWRPIYLSKLPRLEKKIRVALDWTLDLLFYKDLVRLLDLRSPTVSQIEKEVDTSLVKSER